MEKFREEEKTLAGDVLLTSAYLSYVGCFSKNYRTQLLEDKWMPFLRDLKVRTPHSQNAVFSFILLFSPSL